MITSGANQAFVNVVLALVDASDRVVLFSPYYFNHLMALQVRSMLPYLWLILRLVCRQYCMSAHLVIQEVHMLGAADDRWRRQRSVWSVSFAHTAPRSRLAGAGNERAFTTQNGGADLALQSNRRVLALLHRRA